MVTLGAVDLDLWLATWVYPFFRVLALFSSAPLLSHASVPVRVRIGLALLLALLVAPATGGPPVSPYSLAGGLLIIQQILVGVAMGFVVQIAFAAVELAGDLIGLQMGLSLASFIDPQRNEQTPIVASFLAVITMLLFFAIDAHLLLIGAVAESFRALPVGTAALPAPAWREIVATGAMVFSSGLQIALPVLGTLILVNVALAVLARTAPQLNLFAVGFPLTLIVGALVLLLALPRLLPVLQSVLERVLAIAVR